MIHMCAGAYGGQISWNWRYRQLQAAQCVCWELNLGHLQQQ